MEDKYKKITKQSCISLFFNYCIYFYNLRLIHLLIDEITVGDNLRVTNPMAHYALKLMKLNKSDFSFHLRISPVDFPVRPPVVVDTLESCFYNIHSFYASLIKSFLLVKFPNLAFFDKSHRATEETSLVN